MIYYTWTPKYINSKINFPDGSVISIIIWELPKATRERPHGYKYRLSYCTSNGATLLRYDNKLGKGDHKHYDLSPFSRTLD